VELSQIIFIKRPQSPQISFENLKFAFIRRSFGVHSAFIRRSFRVLGRTKCGTIFTDDSKLNASEMALGAGFFADHIASRPGSKQRKKWCTTIAGTCRWGAISREAGDLLDSELERLTGAVKRIDVVHVEAGTVLG
jgi:hypothetical protein